MHGCHSAIIYLGLDFSDSLSPKNWVSGFLDLVRTWGYGLGIGKGDCNLDLCLTIII